MSETTYMKSLFTRRSASTSAIERPKESTPRSGRIPMPLSRMCSTLRKFVGQHIPLHPFPPALRRRLNFLSCPANLFSFHPTFLLRLNPKQVMTNNNHSSFSDLIPTSSKESGNIYSKQTLSEAIQGSLALPTSCNSSK